MHERPNTFPVWAGDRTNLIKMDSIYHGNEPCHSLVHQDIPTGQKYENTPTVFVCVLGWWLNGEVPSRQETDWKWTHGPLNFDLSETHPSSCHWEDNCDMRFFCLQSYTHPAILTLFQNTFPKFYSWFQTC